MQRAGRLVRDSLLAGLVGLAPLSYAQETPRAQLHGAVIDSVSGMPIYEALVEWYDPAGKRQAIVQTNSEGRFALFVVREEELQLRVSENGYQPFSRTLPAFEPGESAREVDVELVPK